MNTWSKFEAWEKEIDGIIANAQTKPVPTMPFKLSLPKKEVSALNAKQNAEAHKNFASQHQQIKNNAPDVGACVEKTPSFIADAPKIEEPKIDSRQEIVKTKAEVQSFEAGIDDWVQKKINDALLAWSDADEEVKANIRWFYKNEDLLPTEPFILDETSLKFNGYEPKKELRINDSKKFYQVLKAEINMGPNGWSAITRVLPNRLKLLRNMVENKY